MSEKISNFNEQPKNTASADEFENFLGDESGDHLYQRLLKTWRDNGLEAAMRFCINDADKFPIGKNKVKSYLEEKLFNAGQDGLDQKTPWNTWRRRDAGLPHLHEFDQL